LPNNNNIETDSTQENIQTTPCFSYPFRVSLQIGTGTRKDKVDLKFEDDPPQEVLDAIFANSFRYDKNLDIWFGNNNYFSRQTAEDIVSRCSLTNSTTSRKGKNSSNYKPYVAKKINPFVKSNISD